MRKPGHQDLPPVTSSYRELDAAVFAWHLPRIYIKKIFLYWESDFTSRNAHIVPQASQKANLTLTSDWNSPDILTFKATPVPKSACLKMVIIKDVKCEASFCLAPNTKREQNPPHHILQPGTNVIHVSVSRSMNSTLRNFTHLAHGLEYRQN